MVIFNALTEFGIAYNMGISKFSSPKMIAVLVELESLEISSSTIFPVPSGNCHQKQLPQQVGFLADALQLILRSEGYS